MNSLPDIFKVKLPEKYSTGVDRMYNFLFDNLGCGWAGRIGHYAWDDGDHERVAKNQDGFIYVWKHTKYQRMISADPTAFRYIFNVKNEDIIEIDVDKYL